MTSRSNRTTRGWLVFAVILAGAISSFASLDPFANATGPGGASAPQDMRLAWVSDHLQVSPKPDDLTAELSFGFTNASASEVVIDHVQTSCSCTAAKLPSQPWHIAPHKTGDIGVTVNLSGKTGDFDKTIDVYFTDTNVAPKRLRVTVKMPDKSMMRAENLRIAAADRQAVFKGDCAKCHAEPAKTATGMALYHQICGVCHEARPRATMVPELRLLPHPTDYEFWRTSIANGKPNTLMPAFAKSQGGPLTDEQIDELARAIETAYPYSRFGGHPPQPPVPAPTTSKN